MEFDLTWNVELEYDHKDKCQKRRKKKHCGIRGLKSEKDTICHQVTLLTKKNELLIRLLRLN